MKQHIILLLGISGSGKSTWAKSMSDSYSVVSLDDLRKEITGDINDKSQDEKVYQQALIRLQNLLELGKNVIIDSTNLTLAKRFPFLKEATLRKISAYYQLMPLNPDQAKLRIQLDLKSGVERANITDETIYRHVGLYLQAVEDIKRENILPFNKL